MSFQQVVYQEFNISAQTDSKGVSASSPTPLEFDSVDDGDTTRLYAFPRKHDKTDQLRAEHKELSENHSNRPCLHASAFVRSGIPLSTERPKGVRGRGRFMTAIETLIKKQTNNRPISRSA